MTIAYFIYIRHMLKGEICKSKSEIESASISIESISSSSLCDMFGARLITQKDKAFTENNVDNFIFIGLLLLKKYFIYFSCVRRADSKLELEKAEKAAKAKSFATINES